MKNPNVFENQNRPQTREIVVLAHNIRSTHNVGSILRTSEGFGISKVIFSGYSPFPKIKNEKFDDFQRLPHVAEKLTQQIAKTALGSEKTVNFEFSKDIFTTISDLKNQGFEIFGLEQAKNSIKLPELSLPKNAKIALILGEEVDGISQNLAEKCDSLLEIPMFGKKESFNVSVAAGVALYKIACE